MCKLLLASTLFFLAMSSVNLALLTLARSGWMTSRILNHFDFTIYFLERSLFEMNFLALITTVIYLSIKIYINPTLNVLN
jgi:hypothetical protein